MYTTKSGIYLSEICDDSSIIHGFSTKQYGDMRHEAARASFLKTIGIDEKILVRQEQIHKSGIHMVSLADRGKMIQHVDGLVYKETRESIPIALSVHTADCIPLLFFDPIQRIIGSAHAGWRGTVLHIGKKMIETMESLGSSVSDIRAIVGPHICGHCYEVDEGRRDVFRKEFHLSPDVVWDNNGKSYVDIGKAIVCDLLTAGMTSEHIDTDQSICTFENEHEWYSFRRSGKPLDGEMMGVIGFLRK